jgi:hypothetical protein
VLAVWYAWLLLAVVSIATASQQYLALGRLSSFPDRAVKLRNLLGHQTAEGWKPRKLQLFIWQTPVMMLNGGIYIFVIGLGVVVYGSTIALQRRTKDELNVVGSETIRTES